MCIWLNIEVYSLFSILERTFLRSDYDANVELFPNVRKLYCGKIPLPHFFIIFINDFMKNINRSVAFSFFLYYSYERMGRILFLKKVFVHAKFFAPLCGEWLMVQSQLITYYLGEALS